MRFQHFGDGAFVDSLLRELENERTKIVETYERKGITEDNIPYFAKFPMGEFALILDDQASGQKFHTSQVLENIATTGRHLGMSTFVTTQKPTLISNTLRMNAQYVFMFRPGRSEYEMYRRDFSGPVFDNTVFLELVMRLTTKHTILIFNRFGNVEGTISSTFLYWLPRLIEPSEWDELRKGIELYQDDFLFDYYQMDKFSDEQLRIYEEIQEELHPKLEALIDKERKEEDQQQEVEENEEKKAQSYFNYQFF